MPDRSPRDQLVRDLAVMVAAATHPSARNSPASAFAMRRLGNMLGLPPGQLTAGDVAARIAAALAGGGIGDPDPPPAGMAVPPADVLARTITPADVAAYPAYFISGPGRDIADRTRCGHGYTLTSSCPCCP